MQQGHGLLIASAFVYLLSVFSAANAAVTRVVVAYSSINPNSSQLEIARAQGFYRKYGLESDIILVRSSATASAGLAAGNIHFGFIGGSALLNAAAEGLPLKMLASFDAQLTYDIIARPEINGDVAQAAIRTRFVTPEARVRSSGATTAITYDCRVGTSISTSASRSRNNRTAAEKLPRDRELVIYCGCCPWDRCPNIKPAIELLHSLGFTTVKAMYSPTNFKTDWIDQGYPVEQ